MIAAKVNQSDINKLVDALKKVGRIITSPNLQLHRAERYRNFTIKTVQKNEAHLKEIKETTKIIQGNKEHPPEWNTGSLLNKMGVRPSGKNEAEAGYFEQSEKIPNKKITYTKAAILQHTGYRIPLFGEKGERVRGFLAFHRIYPKKNRQWLVVQPRPFMRNAYYDYMSKGEDIKAVDEFIDRLMESPVDSAFSRRKGR